MRRKNKSSLFNLSSIDIRQGLNESAPDRVMLYLSRATHYLNTFQTKTAYAVEEIPTYILKYKDLFTRTGLGFLLIYGGQPPAITIFCK